MRNYLLFWKKKRGGGGGVPAKTLIKTSEGKEDVHLSSILPVIETDIIIAPPLQSYLSSNITKVQKDLKKRGENVELLDENTTDEHYTRQFCCGEDGTVLLWRRRILL